MSVHDHTWRPYKGELTELSTRFLVLPKFGLRQLFQSRVFLLFLTACFAFPVVSAIAIYLQHNLGLLAELEFEIPKIFSVSGSFYHRMLVVQSVLGFLVTVVVGPSLVSPDLVNGALPLYLSRPLTRFEYVIGKLTLLVGMLSAITWIPAWGLYLLEASLVKGFFFKNLSLVATVFVASWATIAVMALPAFAISAYSRSRANARVVFVVFFFFASGIGEMINQILDVQWGSLLKPSHFLDAVWSGCFGLDYAVSPYMGWTSVTLVIIASVIVIRRKLTAFEVVK